MRTSSILHAVDTALEKAFKIGNIPKIKRLLLTPDLDSFEEFPYILGDSLEKACEKGQLELVQFLLTATEFEDYIDINHNQGDPLICATSSGHLDIVKYLLTFPDLKEHADLHILNDIVFKITVEHSQFHILNYFIQELNIPRSSNIDNYLKEHPNEKVEHMFQLRELNKELSSELNNSDMQTKRVKL